MSAPEHVKQAVDVLSVSTVVATIAGWLPAVAALATIIWTIIRIFETRTVKGLIIRRRCKVADGGCPWVCSPDFGCEHYPQKTIPIREVRE